MWIQLNDEELGLIKATLSVFSIQAAKDLVEKIEEKQSPASEDAMRDLLYQAAASQYHRDGELEFDGDMVVSAGEDPGAYVMCWRWVTNEEAGVTTPGRCITCGEPYDEAGDGWDGECPDCADVTEAKLQATQEGGHDLYPWSDWQYEVTNGDTKLGYADWLQGKLESEGDDANTSD